MAGWAWWILAGLAVAAVFAVEGFLELEQLVTRSEKVGALVLAAGPAVVAAARTRLPVPAAWIVVPALTLVVSGLLWFVLGGRVRWAWYRGTAGSWCRRHPGQCRGYLDLGLPGAVAARLAARVFTVEEGAALGWQPAALCLLADHPPQRAALGRWRPDPPQRLVGWDIERRRADEWPNVFRPDRVPDLVRLARTWPDGGAAFLRRPDRFVHVLSPAVHVERALEFRAVPGVGSDLDTVLRLVTGHGVTAEQYRAMQRLLGGTDDPAAVRRADRLIDRLATELEERGRDGRSASLGEALRWLGWQPDWAVRVVTGSLDTVVERLDGARYRHSLWRGRGRPDLPEHEVAAWWAAGFTPEEAGRLHRAGRPGPAGLAALAPVADRDPDAFDFRRPALWRRAGLTADEVVAMADAGTLPDPDTLRARAGR